MKWVVAVGSLKHKAHTGGRGKAGGVVVATSVDEVATEAGRMLSNRLVTKQTGEAGLPVSFILVEEPSDIQRELYLSVLVDRETRKILIMASQAGGMNIEEVAEETPEKILDHDH